MTKSNPKETNNTSTTIVTISDARIQRGQRAWWKLRASAQEQRELWRDVGEALLVGRRLYPSNQSFNQWLKLTEFDGIKKSTRADAMWLAEQWCAVFQSLDNETSHPTALRKLYREWEEDHQYQQEAEALDLQNLSVTQKPTVELDQRSAERIAKTHYRSNSGDEGSAIAQKHLEGLAKKHGVTIDGLMEAVAQTAPAAYYLFTPAQLVYLKDIEESVMETVPEMLASGLSAEAIGNCFIMMGGKIKRGEC